MFTKSLDIKGTYIKDGVQLKDLTESIFKIRDYDLNVVYSYYKVAKDLEMRPDQISRSLYGTEEYAEIVMKHSIIDNPFAIEEGDILIAPSFTSVYNNIKDVEDYETEDSDRPNTAYDLVQNYHKYIDKTKIPTDDSQNNDDIDISKTAADVHTAESQNYGNMLSGGSLSFDEYGNPIYNSNTPMSTGKTTGEANLANKGNSGIYIKNGKIYFGPNVSTSTLNATEIEGSNLADNELVDCARNGATLGQFLNSIIKVN